MTVVISGPDATAGSTWILWKNIGTMVPIMLETTMATTSERPTQPEIRKAESHAYFLKKWMFIGMSMDTTREEMTQAVLEGVAFGLRDSLEVARSLGISPERTKICGGGAKSPLWRQIIANVMNLKVDVLENEEGLALGGAMLAAVGCGEYPDVETAAAKIVKVVDTVTPEPELTRKYEERYQYFRMIYPTVKELY